MNKLQIFNSSEFGEIRTITKDGEVWFVGKDIADKLGYRNGSRDINRHVFDEDRKEITIHDGTQNRNMICINESGVYALVFGSELESAKRFKHWVTSEVLPAIRKTGSYSVPKTPSEQIQLIAKGYVELEQTVNNIKEDVTDLKDNMPLYGCEIDEVCNHVKRKAVDVLGGKESEAYHDSSIRGQVFSNIYTRLKMEYRAVSSYKSIKRKYLADVHDFIDCYELPKFLDELVNDANAQMRVCV